jgi:hypothetical protein
LSSAGPNLGWLADRAKMGDSRSVQLSDAAMTSAPPAGLAIGLGAYLLLSATGFLFPRRAAEAVVEALRSNPALAHLAGAVAFLTGGGVIAV